MHIGRQRCRQTDTDVDRHTKMRQTDRHRCGQTYKERQTDKDGTDRHQCRQTWVEADARTTSMAMAISTKDMVKTSLSVELSTSPLIPKASGVLRGPGGTVICGTSKSVTVVALVVELVLEVAADKDEKLPRRHFLVPVADRFRRQARQNSVYIICLCT